jgi:sugar/nucleoside kinase (ribokinase family)
MMKNTAMIVGPINIDYMSSINSPADEVLKKLPSPYIPSKITKNVGGMGFLAAIASRSVGFQPYLVSSIGGSNDPDSDGSFLLQELKSHNIVGNIKVVNGFKTASVFLVYFKNKSRRLTELSLIERYRSCDGIDAAARGPANLDVECHL